MALVDHLVADLERMGSDVEPVTPDARGLEALRGLVAANLAIAEKWAPIVPVLTRPGSGESPARARTVESVTVVSRRIGAAFAEGGAGASDPFVAALAITGLTDGFGHQVRTWDLELDRETVAESLTALAYRMLHPEARLPAA